MIASDGPLISVVVPAFDAERYLGATLRSLTAQTYTNFELIVVDDGSTDATVSIVESLAERDDRVRLVRHERNRGRSAARNRGLDEARGEWICPTDADDLWSAERLAEIVRTAAKFPDARLMTDDLIGFTVGADGEVSLQHRFVSRSTLWAGRHHPISVRNWYLDQQCTMNPIVRRDLLDESGARYPEAMSAGEDLAFNLELVFARAPSNPVRIGMPLYYYRVGESTRAANMAESQVRMIRHVLERTGNADLDRWSRRAEPGWVFIYQRADRQFSAAGRSARRDAGVDDIELVASPSAGYRRLALNKVLEVLGRLSDRSLRPGIVADITAQLSRGAEVTGA